MHTIRRPGSRGGQPASHLHVLWKRQNGRDVIALLVALYGVGKHQAGNSNKMM